MRKYYLLSIVILSFCFGFSQAPNSWINYGQQYYKIKVAKDGIYRIDSVTLANAGVPLPSIDPRNFQLFQRGIEIPAYISGEADGIFNGSDAILFFARKNSCVEDSLLFDNPPFLTNPYYSVINDTAAVFLTWNSSFSNKRFTLETDTVFGPYSPASYFFKEQHSNRGWYNPGPLNVVNSDDPRYKTGEGFYIAEIAMGQNYTETYNTSGIVAAGGNAILSFSISGSNNIFDYSPDHDIVVEYTNASGVFVPLSVMSFDGFKSYRYNYTIPASNLGPTTQIRVTSLNNPNYYKPNYTTINFTAIFFPQNFNLLGVSEQLMVLPDQPSQLKSFLNITNFTDPGNAPWLLDLTNEKIIPVVYSGGIYKALVPNSGLSKICFIAASDKINPVSKIEAVNGTGLFTNFGSLNLDSAYLIVTHPTLMTGSAVTQYANYRSSISGGGYNVVVAKVTELYDQFAFGVDRHSLAIRNFASFVIANSSKLPSALFLIGKGIHAQHCITNGNNARNSLVPSFGNPSSDVLLTAGLTGASGNIFPSIPTGRIAAKTPQDILNYLSKVQLYEMQKDSLWQKNIVHFVGGISSLEQMQFKNYMNHFESIIEDTLFGGQVYSFYKTTTTPLAITTNDSIKKIIEGGTSILCFFGHGSATGFEQNIDDPNNYNNSPKFPLLISNSCYTGDIFSPSITSSSERFVLAPNNRGSIGYLSSVSAGVAHALYYYTSEFYRHVAYRKYGRTYGELVQSNIRQLMQDFSTLYGNDTILELTCMDMTFHGDPAVKAVSSPYPDYRLRNQDVIFNTNQYVDSIGIKMIIANLGRAVKDSFSVYIERILPSGDTNRIYKRIRGPYNMDTLQVFIVKDLVNGIGLNQFYIKVDNFNERIELNEFNNATNGYLPLVIPGGDIVPVWPYKFAIIPDINKVTLKASTADPFAQLYTYRLQVDTSDAFVNPLVNTLINAPGGVVSYNLNLIGQDSLVYFWRIAKDSVTPNWRESSFQVINGKYGWGQAHFHQFKDDGFQFVKYNKPQRKLEFFNDIRTIQVNTGMEPYVPFSATQFFYNNAQQRLWGCGVNGFSVVVFDSITGGIRSSDTTINNGNGTWQGMNNNCVCDINSSASFDFGKNMLCWVNTNWRQDMANFINSLPNGTPVLAYSVKYCFSPSCQQDTLTPALISAFQSIGAGQLANMRDTLNYVIFGRKGMLPGQAHEKIATNRYELTTFIDSIRTKFNRGYVSTGLIGPAKSWGSFHWRQSPEEMPTKDSVYVQIYGSNGSGTEVLVKTIFSDSTDVLNLSSSINASQFPYIRLVARMRDDSLNTPAQLKRWQVIYDQAPEAALHPPAGFAIDKPVAQEGDQVIIKMPIKNVSDHPFTDSLLVTYYLEDKNRVIHPLPYKLKKAPFLSDSIIVDTIAVQTYLYPGNNALWMDVNALGHPKNQLEQFHFNNIARIPFRVDQDRINPLLDVTFDGIHILNGDIVSAKPYILVSLKDENKFLALNDTASFRIYLTEPGNATEHRLYFKNALNFIPANLPNNSCKIEYRPEYVVDGTYKLRVEAIDRSGNKSGSVSYDINFEVINKSTITEVLNYPNPFSTSTRFVFTLTGSEIPETFKIQILTITGRVVKEISRADLGVIRIGKNVSEYAWDGTDDYGDKLANGVYLYKVQTRLNGSEIEKRNTSADQYFKKGFGKLVIMR